MSRLTELLGDGKPIFGSYLSFASPLEIQSLARAGLDFVRLDGYTYQWEDEARRELVDACRQEGIAPWARSTSEPDDLRRWLDAGVDGLTVPEVSSAAEAAEIAAATRGRRADVLLGCQVESLGGLKEMAPIIATQGVDVIHSGRTDLARALTGIPDPLRPEALEAELRIVDEAVAAGKMMALMYALDDNGLQRVEAWMRKGVRIFALDFDAAVLERAFRAALLRLANEH